MARAWATFMSSFPRAVPRGDGKGYGPTSLRPFVGAETLVKCRSSPAETAGSGRAPFDEAIDQHEIGGRHCVLSQLRGTHPFHRLRRIGIEFHDTLPARDNVERHQQMK